MQIALFGYDLIPVNTCISACVKVQMFKVVCVLKHFEAISTLKANFKKQCVQARQQDAAASLLRKAGPCFGCHQVETQETSTLKPSMKYSCQAW